jgi:hypothetical protein
MPGSADVTLADAMVTVTYRVVDAVDVSSATIRFWDHETQNDAWVEGQDSRLVAGTTRDGTWQSTVRLPQHVDPMTWSLRIEVRDVENRTAEVWPPGTLQVVNATPGRVPQQVQILTPADHAEYDVDASAHQITVRARVTSPQNEVTRVWLVLVRPPGPGELGDGTNWEGGGRLVSGDGYDGVWQADLGIPPDVPTGGWFLEASVQDETDVRYDADEFVTPEHVDSYFLRRTHVFTGGGGHLDMVDHVPGTASKLEDYDAPKNQTLHRDGGAASLPVTVQVSDVDSTGTSAVGVEYYSEDHGVTTARASLARQDGTVRAGTWRGTVVIPADFPAGDYCPRIFVDDENHHRVYLDSYAVAAANDWTALQIPTASLHCLHVT